MNKFILRTLIIFGGAFFVCSPTSNAKTIVQEETLITGKIISGNLSMSTPNNIDFNIQLTGENFTKMLEDIRTSTTDYRGNNQGWKIMVSSPNYSSYQNNFNLVLNGHEITDKQLEIVRQDSMIQIKRNIINTRIKISSKAQAGSYIAILEWNLQPINNIKE
ncbi:hypothetical protein [Enterococcus hailinensis]|uniref:hypothetical protein n=1 Tax=Enterococcus hailinensis TaxID=3238988 RepID=UPI0038B3C4A1